MSSVFSILQVVLGIGFLIFIHEAGHYLCARLAGIRVEVFSLGFGPRLLGFRRGTTDYRLALVPIGGYVRVAGEDPHDRRYVEDGDLNSRSLLARMFFFSGGVLMNLLFAVIAFPLVFNSGVEFTAPVLGDVTEGGAAWKVGLRPGDRVRSVDGKSMYSFQNMLVEVALAGSRPAVLEIERDGSLQTIEVQPVYDARQGVYSLAAGPPVDPEPPTLEVTEDSPAWRAGLRTGDQWIGLQGREIDPATIYERMQDASREGGPVSVEVRRDGERHAFDYQPAASPVPMLGVERTRRRVAGIRPGLAALEALALRPGDHIIDVDGQVFAGATLAPFAEGPPQLTMTVQRQGDGSHRLSAPFTAAERKALAEHVGFATDEIGIVVLASPNTPAERAGILPGDAVVRIDGKPVADWPDLRDAVQSAAGKALRLTLRSAAGEREVSVTPGAYADLGFVARSKNLLQLYRVDGFGAALNAGMVCSVDLIKQLYVTLKKLFTGEVAAKNLGGIITISRVSYIYAESGWARFIYFLALLSINLAFINVLPIPVLDGGHLLFLAIEGIKGSPVSPRILNYSQIFGLVFVLALIVFVTYNDILRLL